jgi:RNA polymerase sigma-70 factor (ECF subfamily)
MDVEFESFVEMVGPRLRAALVAAYGEDAGLDAAAEALAYAWEHWERLRSMQNPAGYLYRVGQSAARRLHRRPTLLPEPAAGRMPDFEPALLPALDSLSEAQRVCVVLVHGFAWRQVDVAELLEIESATVRTHLSRGLRKLNHALEGSSHASS